MLRDGSVEIGGEASAGSGVGGDSAHGERCDRLHRRLKRIVKARGALDLEEAAALREAQALMIWRRYGYGSLLEYMEMEMGYSPRAAIERLRVAHAIVELPKITEAMEQGDLSFSGARELTRVAAPETEGDWLRAIEGKNLRQIEAEVSGRKRGDRPTDPVDPALKTMVLRLEVREEVFALWRQVQQAIEKERGERLDDNGLVEALGRCYLGAKIGEERNVAPYQIAVMVCTECKRGWQDGGGITAEMSPPAVERAQCDAVHIGSIDDDEETGASDARDLDPTAGVNRPGSSSTSPAGAQSIGSLPPAGGLVGPPNVGAMPFTSSAHKSSSGSKRKRAKWTIPPALRRKVKRRDHGRCCVPWCRSSRNVDIHHLRPVSLGGDNTMNNMASLCEAHHLAVHDGTLTITIEGDQLTFERQGRNNFTRAERAVDTRLALKGLGFKADEIKAAVDKTITHVGSADLSLDQWIKIALGYCPSALTEKAARGGVARDERAGRQPAYGAPRIDIS